MNTLIEVQLNHFYQKLDLLHREACSQHTALTLSHGCCAKCEHNICGLCHQEPLLKIKNRFRQSLFFFGRSERKDMNHF